MVDSGTVVDRATSGAYFVSEDIGGDRSVKIPIPFCHVGVILAVFDATLIFVLAVANYAAYNFVTTGRLRFSGCAFAVGLTGALLFCLLMQAQRLYQTANILNQARAAADTLNIWLTASASALALGFLAHASGDYSRGAAVCLFFSGAVALPTSRILAKRVLTYLIANNLLEGRRKVVLFGETGHMVSYGVSERLSRYGYKVIGRFGVESSETGGLVAGLNRLSEFVKSNRVDEIFLAFDGGNRRIIQAVSHRLIELPIPVRLLFDQHMDELLSLPISDLGAAKSVKLQGGPLKPLSQFLKRAFDVSLASTGLVLLAPLLLLIGLAIRIDSAGPIIFRQRRIGFSGRVFQIYKFRSMTTMDDGQLVRQATRGDSRVTRVGGYIRRTSLDELPQLLNVLRGEMSIVGPRPHAISHDDEYTRAISTYALRHHMKPGITGWAQVNGCRGETSALASMEQRVQFDIWYIKHWTMMLDFKAVAKTVWQVIFPKNVY